MQQGEFYLTSDEAHQQRLDRSVRPNALDVHEEAGATSEQALTQNVTASEQYLHIAYDAVGCGVVVWSTVNQVVAANKVAGHILGMNLDEMQDSLAAGAPGVFTRPDGTPLPLEERSYYGAFRTGNAQHNMLEGFIHPGGQVRWLQVDAVPVRGVDETITHVVVSFTDVTEHIEAWQRASENEARLQTVISNVPAILCVIDRTGIITFLEGKGIETTRSRMGEAIVTSVFDLYRNIPEALHNLGRALEGQAFTALNKIDGRMFESHFMPVRDQNDEVTSIICLAIDVTERMQAEKMVQAKEERVAMEKRLRYHTLHDSLTNLPDRTLFQEQLEEALLTAKHAKSGLALLTMDVDRFKDVNDTFGHQHGDFLLQQIGVRLRKAVNLSDIVARLGGDEFAVLLPTADEKSARKVASELRAVLDEPFIVAGYPLQIEASMGIVLYPAHGTDILTLLRRADVAMYTAKRRHEGYTFYDTAYDEQSSPRRLALVGALRRAITTNELALYYQPIVDLKTAASSRVEALARWQHPTYGFVPPDQFILLAEQTGLITPFTHWALEAAVRQCSEWLHAGLDLSVAVNLSMWNLREVTLPDTIARLLKGYNVPARLLRVELTESAIMADTDLALDVLKRLSALGIRISIDDFGTGYSSLAYLKRLPVDELKIDRSFVQHMTSIETDATIVRSTVTMAHGLGLQIVAEGVEDEPIWDLLAAFDCDAAQGYYMSRPLPAQDLEHWLRNTKQTVAH